MTPVDIAAFGLIKAAREYASAHHTLEIANRRYLNAADEPYASVRIAGTALAEALHRLEAAARALDVAERVAQGSAS